MTLPVLETVETAKEAISLLDRFGAWVGGIGVAMTTAFWWLFRWHSTSVGERVQKVEVAVAGKASVASVEAVAADLREIKTNQTELVRRVDVIDTNVTRMIEERRQDVETFREVFANQREDNKRNGDAISGMTKAVTDYTQKITEMMSDRPTRGEIRGLVDRRKASRD